MQARVLSIFGVDDLGLHILDVVFTLLESLFVFGHQLLKLEGHIGVRKLPVLHFVSAHEGLV